MAKFLQQLLGAKEPHFSTTLRQLETMTGHKGTDVRYIADVTERAHEVMRKIGLDPADTTPMELYKSLESHADNKQLFKHTDDVGLIIGGKPVSFNIDDIHANKKHTFELRITDHMKCQLQHGLMARYAEHDSIDEVLIEEMIAQAGVERCPMDEYHARKVEQQAEEPYILCVGDIFSDTFIKLLESEAKIDVDDKGNKWLSVPFGSKPPYDSAETVYSVGPSPNAAVSCARLGTKVGLMSWLGDDRVSKSSLTYLAHEKIDTVPMVIQKNSLSSVYYVLRYGADRTILVKNEDYSYKWVKPKTKPDWIYLSLISPNSWPLHLDLLDYLDDHADVKLAFQPGTFHFKWGVEKLKKVYKRSHIVVLNREEAVDVTGESYDSIRGLATALHALGPKLVVITDGPNGSYASDGTKVVQIPNYPDPAPPYDRTGAGDAFASTIVASLALGNDFETAISWAPINSMNVVQHLGAQKGLLSQKEIHKLLEAAPEWYKAEEYKG
jgi:sugar/nucleoside kinase (ribokinase family)